MNILDAILTRRSIRKYKLDELPEGTIEKILHAAMSAPSSGNQRTWKFIVVTKKEMKEKIIEAYPYTKFIIDAPAVIIVCFDKSVEKYEGYWEMDCSAATQNILIAANGLGLSSVWLSVYPEQDYFDVSKLRQSFSIPEDVIPFAALPIAYADEVKETENRFDESLVHSERWQVPT